MGHSGLVLLTLSSSRFDPKPTFIISWALQELSWPEWWAAELQRVAAPSHDSESTAAGCSPISVCVNTDCKNDERHDLWICLLSGVGPNRFPFLIPRNIENG
jgi:hypothetical protein